jgi:hypothetical protein
MADGEICSNHHRNRTKGLTIVGQQTKTRTIRITIGVTIYNSGYLFHRNLILFSRRKSATSTRLPPCDTR